MTQVTRSRSALGLMALIAACATQDSRLATHVPTFDTLPNGAIYVHNTGPTAWADTNGWRLVLEQTIAPGDGEPGELNEPRDIVVDSHGNIFVADYKPSVIKMYGPDGAFVRTVGREGSGPGEFLNASLLMTRDTLVVHDSRQSRTMAFTADGEFIHAWMTMCCHNRPLLANNAGLVPIPGSIAPDTTADGEPSPFIGTGVVWYSLDGTPHDSLVFPPEPEQPLWQIGDKDNLNITSIPFHPGLTTRFAPNGLLYWGIQDAYRIVVSSNGIDTLRIIESTAPAVPLPDTLRQFAVDQMIKEDARWRGVAKLSDIPTMHPVWTGVVVDQSGNLWVLLPGPQSEGDSWDVFDPEGRLLGKVAAPFAATYRTYWGADRVYQVTEDEAGLPVIRIYRIDRSLPAQ